MSRALDRARAGDEEAFRVLTDPYRREIRAHCYRILGSVQDAEDMLQETLLAAWRGLDGFAGRSSLRSWLHRIAINQCLNALRATGRRRPAPEPPFAAPDPTRVAEPCWLEPFPDSLMAGLADPTPGPEARYEARESIELAFVVALQQLPPRQRAALVLRDVLGFRAGEVAEMLDTTEAGVKGALQRARATLAACYMPDRKLGRANGSAVERELVARFADALENDDIDGIVQLPTEDAWLTMPPSPLEYQGPTAIASLLQEATKWRGAHANRLVATHANVQPAFACYVRDQRAPIARANGLIVLTLRGTAISAITRFLDSAVFSCFGLPRTLPDEPLT